MTIFSLPRKGRSETPKKGILEEQKIPGCRDLEIADRITPEFQIDPWDK